MNGELSLLDLDDGRERELTDSVELFWVTCGQSDEKTNLIEEVSWLDYGHRGMQVNVFLGHFFYYCVKYVTFSLLQFSLSLSNRFFLETSYCRYGIHLLVWIPLSRRTSCR